MTVENHNGYWIISDVINGYLVTEKYMYYTKKQSIKMFKENNKETDNNDNG